MKRFLLLVNFALLLSLTVFGSELTPKSGSTIIYGRIIDEKSAEAAPYATISIVGTTKGVTSDAMGNFTLEGIITDGDYELQVQALGYTTQKSDVTLKSGESTTLVSVPRLAMRV